MKRTSAPTLRRSQVQWRRFTKTLRGALSLIRSRSSGIPMVERPKALEKRPNENASEEALEQRGRSADVPSRILVRGYIGRERACTAFSKSNEYFRSRFDAGPVD